MKIKEWENLIFVMQIVECEAGCEWIGKEKDG